MKINNVNLVINKSGNFTLYTNTGQAISGLSAPIVLTDAKSSGTPYVKVELIANIHHSEQEMLDYVKENKEKPY